MEIPRQKKTVRVAVTRPSVKKGTIRATAQTQYTKLVSRTNYNMSWLLEFHAAKQTLSSPFSIAISGEKAWSVLSFQLLAPERNCVLVSAHVPINPCK